jgi:hypothetical protein
MVSPIIERIFSEKARCWCRSPCACRGCGASDQKTTCLYQTTSSHGILNYITALSGKAVYSSRKSCNRIVTIGFARAPVTAFHQARGFDVRQVNCSPSFGSFLFLTLTESAANCRDEFFVVKWFHEKGDRADGHCGSTRGQIFSCGDDNNTSLR